MREKKVTKTIFRQDELYDLNSFLKRKQLKATGLQPMGSWNIYQGTFFFLPFITI